MVTWNIKIISVSVFSGMHILQNYLLCKSCSTWPQSLLFTTLNNCLSFCVFISLVSSSEILKPPAWRKNVFTGKICIITLCVCERETLLCWFAHTHAHTHTHTHTEKTYFQLSSSRSNWTWLGCSSSAEPLDVSVSHTICVWMRWSEGQSFLSVSALTVICQIQPQTERFNNTTMCEIYIWKCRARSPSVTQNTDFICTTWGWNLPHASCLSGTNCWGIYGYRINILLVNRQTCPPDKHSYKELKVCESLKCAELFLCESVQKNL